MTIEKTGEYEICNVCNWEDDPMQSKDPTLGGGANILCLDNARKEFKNITRRSDRPSVPGENIYININALRSDIIKRRKGNMKIPFREIQQRNVRGFAAIQSHKELILFYENFEGIDNGGGEIDDIFWIYPVRAVFEYYPFKDYSMEFFQREVISVKSTVIGQSMYRDKISILDHDSVVGRKGLVIIEGMDIAGASESPNRPGGFLIIAETFCKWIVHLQATDFIEYAICPGVIIKNNAVAELQYYKRLNPDIDWTTH